MSQKYKYQHNWLIETDLEKIKDKLRLLEEALENKDFEKITSFLKNTVFLRSIIVQKGAGGNPHKLLEKSFIFLLAHNFGEGKDFFSLTAEEIIDFLHKNDLPEQLLNELANIAYHQRNKNKFLKITDIILENKNSFFDKAVPIRALHDLASWKSQREGKAEEAIKLNKVVIGEAKKIGDTVLEKKAIFGLTYDKNIKFKNKIKSYKDLEISLKADAGNFYDSLRGKIEGARELLNFAKLKKEDFKKQLLIEAKDASLTALKDAINVGYIRAEELASDLLSEIYKELRDERKQKSYEKRANELRNKFSFPGAIDNK